MNSYVINRKVISTESKITEFQDHRLFDKTLLSKVISYTGGKKKKVHARELV